VSGFCEGGNEPPGFIKAWEVLGQLREYQLVKGFALWSSESYKAMFSVDHFLDRTFCLIMLTCQHYGNKRG
jgi:hypothetical protein